MNRVLAKGEKRMGEGNHKRMETRTWGYVRTGTQTDKQTDRQTDRQTHDHTGASTHALD